MKRLPCTWSDEVPKTAGLGRVCWAQTYDIGPGRWGPEGVVAGGLEKSREARRPGAPSTVLLCGLRKPSDHIQPRTLGYGANLFATWLPGRSVPRGLPGLCWDYLMRHPGWVGSSERKIPSESSKVGPGPSVLRPSFPLLDPQIAFVPLPTLKETEGRRELPITEQIQGRSERKSQLSSHVVSGSSHL